MEHESGAPQTLVEAVRYFADPDVCLSFLTSLRWPDGNVRCPQCGSEAVTFLKNQRRWKCREKHPRQQFTIKVGTIMEDSPIPLDKWLPAIWMVVNDKNGISSYEVARALGITQKSAWFMMHRVRLAMQRGSLGKFSGRVEADETYIGGAARFMHKRKREAQRVGSRAIRKTAVMGLLERHGPDKVSQVRAFVVPTTKRKLIDAKVREHVAPGSEILTDSLPSYSHLSDEYTHNVINHAESYVRGHIHTNGLENFWSLLKRAIKGTYVNVEPFHLFRYLDEQAFRFNARGAKDAGRFLEVLRTIVGRRLTYKELIGDAGLATT